MIKRLAALAVLCCGFIAVAHAEYPDAIMPATSVAGGTLFNVNDTSNATFDIVAAPGSGSYNRLLGFGVSLNAADNLTFKCGSTTKIGPIYFSANSGLVQSFEDLKFRCGNNEAFKVTKGSASTGVTVWGNARTE